MPRIDKLPTPSQDSLSSVNGFPRYSEAEMQRRYDALRRVMDDVGTDVAVVCGGTSGLETSVLYFTNWAPSVESYLVVPRQGDPVLLARLWNHLPDARLISVVEDVRYGGDTPAEQAENVADLLASMGFDGRGIGWIGPLRAADMTTLQRRLASATFTDLNAAYQDLRLVKSEEEMVYTRIAAGFNDAAVAAMEAGIRPGMREYEIAKVIEGVYLDQRGVNLIHFTMSTPMSDPRVCVPHQQHPDRVVQQGDVVVTEISTTFWGYAGQILRSFTVGAEPTPLYRDLHAVAVQAYDDMTGLLRAGVTVGELLEAAEVIDKAGYSIWDDLVHGFGGAYLPPILRTRQTRGATHPDDYAYPTGTVLVVQPNVITPDARAGVQVGNALRITDDGAEVLQEHPMGFLRCA
jgi:Xaa-Pro aminopeptidase